MCVVVRVSVWQGTSSGIDFSSYLTLITYPHCLPLLLIISLFLISIPSIFPLYFLYIPFSAIPLYSLRLSRPPSSSLPLSDLHPLLFLYLTSILFSSFIWPPSSSLLFLHPLLFLHLLLFLLFLYLTSILFSSLPSLPFSAVGGTSGSPGRASDGPWTRTPSPAYKWTTSSSSGAAAQTYVVQ